jgi:hypothetical protein
VSHSDRIVRGDFYEDCRYHPMLCVAADYEEDELLGISLFLGGEPGSCSPTHCGVVPMTYDEAIERAVHWDEFARERGLPARAEPPDSRPVG